MELTSTRDPALRATFLEAAARNVPGDGGLYLPARWSAPADLDTLLDLGWAERARALLDRWLGDELEPAEIAEVADGALDFPAPLVAITGGRDALELWHGPSLSFKDFGVRFLARVLLLLTRRLGDGATRTVLTATSGDTGAAVAHAFHGLPGFRVAVLYPRGRISELQERQIATLGGNVRAFAVEGAFDDCQRLVKACFADPELARALGLVSANSIHVARLLAQVLYYVEAVAALRRAGRGEERPWIAVPCGNFGNLCAGLLAWRLGLPISGLVAATNANRVVPDYLDGGAYRPRPSVATLSNAMDVGAPNNWERIDRMFAGDRDTMRRALRWGSADDSATRHEIARLERLGYRADPHGAVASAVLERCLGPRETGIFLATAHPAKFLPAPQPNRLPPALAAALARPLLVEPLAADTEALRAALRIDAVTR